MNDHEDPTEFGPVPDHLQDNRKVFRRLGVRWYLIDLCDAERGDTLAIVEDPVLGAGDVRLWKAISRPFRNASGMWTAHVEAISHTCLEHTD